MKIQILSLRAGTVSSTINLNLQEENPVSLQSPVWVPQHGLLGFLLGSVHMILLASRGWPSVLQIPDISVSSRFAVSGQMVRIYAFHARFWISWMTLLSLYRYHIHSNINMMNRNKSDLYFLFQTLQSWLELFVKTSWWLTAGFAITYQTGLDSLHLNYRMQEYFPDPRFRASVFTPLFWKNNTLCGQEDSKDTPASFPVCVFRQHFGWRIF